MDGDKLGPIIEGDAIAKDLRLRRSKDIHKKITAKTASLLKEKAALEVQDGWRIAKKNKRSYVLAQLKKTDEQLEDEVWCMMAKMGFTELSYGRNFQMNVGKEVPSRQIDIFAKDEEVALIVECTQCEEPKTKSMMKLIEKLMAIRSGLYKSVTAYYGREADIKPRLVIATRNVVWRNVDLLKCQEADISILADDELDY